MNTGLHVINRCYWPCDMSSVSLSETLAQDADLNLLLYCPGW